MQIIDHYLSGDNIDVTKKTPNTSGQMGGGLPDTIVIHYTAGSTVSSAINTLTNPNVQASAHMVVGPEGEVSQLAAFNTITWHAGKSSWDGRTNLNQYSIGIEIVNPGVLTKKADGKYYTWYDAVVDPSNVIEAIHRNETTPRFWYTYPERQLTTVSDICSLLKSTYNIKYIVGHEEIAPGRKIDPGPAYPLDKLRTLLLGSRKDDSQSVTAIPESGVVAVDKLNIRANPAGDAAMIALPLVKGTNVKILDAKDGWYKVTTEITGWVSGKFINQR